MCLTLWMKIPRPIETKPFIQCQGFHGRAGPETNSLYYWTGPFKNYSMVLPVQFIFSVWCVCVYVLVAQSCLTLCDPMDCSPSGFSVHGILQARMLE